MKNKLVSKGVKGSGCHHNKCTIIDTHTEYNEVLTCLDCGLVMTRKEWDDLHAKGWKNWNPDWISIGYLYIIAYVFFLLLWTFTL